MIDLKNINTERRNEKTMELDLMSATEIVQIINEEDANIHVAINKQVNEIAQVVKAAATAIENNGRLIYIGAGTSGRLGLPPP